jgi:hypothetical protein
VSALNEFELQLTFGLLIRRGGSPTETVKEESAPSNGAGTLPSQSAQQPSGADFLEEIPVRQSHFYGAGIVT